MTTPDTVIAPSPEELEAFSAACRRFGRFARLTAPSYLQRFWLLFTRPDPTIGRKRRRRRARGRARGRG